MATAPIGYTDTRRQAMDVPNVGASIVEAYMGYRVSIANAVFEARLQAMGDAQKIKAEYIKAANAVDDERAKLLETAQRLMTGQMSMAAAQKSALGQVFSASMGVESAEINAKGQTESARIGGEYSNQAAEIRAAADRDVARLQNEGKILEGGKIPADRVKEHMAAAMAAIAGFSNQAETDPDTAVDELANAFARIRARVETAETNPITRAAILNEIDQQVQRGAFEGQYGNLAKFVSTASRSTFETELPNEPVLTKVERKSYGANIKADPTTIPKVMGAGAEGWSGREGDTMEAIEGRRSGMEAAIRESSSGIDTSPLLKRIYDELDAAPDRRAALLKAADEVDPTGGLGGFFDPLPSGPPRVRNAATLESDAAEQKAAKRSARQERRAERQAEPELGSITAGPVRLTILKPRSKKKRSASELEATGG